MSATVASGRTARDVVRHGVRGVALALVLGVTALVVPDSAVPPAESLLVRVQRADGVDLSPEVIWILAVGSDARPGQELTRTRGDALQLVGINTKTGAATAIGVPRDSWVSIPGVGSSRINAALTYGGPKLMGRAIGDLIGIEPDYVMVAGFRGFAKMIAAIGGITVRSRYTFSDSNLAPRGFVEGENRLNGYLAMAFSRVRKSLPGGDFDRSANQQRTLVGILRRIRERSEQPGFVHRGVLQVAKSMATDVPPSELFRIAQAIAQVDPRRVTTCVVQGSIGNVGGASVVLPFTDQARRYGDDARRDATIRRC